MKIAPLSTEQDEVLASILPALSARAENQSSKSNPWQRSLKKIQQGHRLKRLFKDGESKEEERTPWTADVRAAFKHAFGYAGGVTIDERSLAKRRMATWSRKILRFAILITLIVLVLFNLSWFSSQTKELSEKVSLQIDRGLQISLQNCQLEFSMEFGADAPPVGSIRASYLVFYNSGGKTLNRDSIVWTTVDSQPSSHITLLNKMSRSHFDSCILSVELARNASLPNMTIECEDHCLISTRFSPQSNNGPLGLSIANEWLPYWYIEGLLKIRGGLSEGAVKLENLDVGALDIAMTIADIFLEDVRIRGSQASSIQSDRGDVHAQVHNDMYISWTDSTNMYCLAAGTSPTVSLSAASCNDSSAGSLNLSSSNASVASTCAGSASLCTAVVCSATLPALALKVPSGGMYVTRVGDNSSKILHPIAGAGFGIGTKNYEGVLEFPLQLDYATTQSLVLVKANLADTGTSSTVYALEGPKYARFFRPGNAFLWGVSRTEAGAQIGAWWLRIVTVGLLVRGVQTEPIRFHAGICPYTSRISEASVLRMAAVLRDHALEDPLSNVLAYIIPATQSIGDNLPTFRYEEPRMRYYAPVPLVSGGRTRDKWLRVQFGDEIEELAAWHNMTLLLAVFTSFFVAAVVGCVFTRAAYIGISEMVWIFGTASSHVQSYRIEVAGEANPHKNTHVETSSLVNGPLSKNLSVVAESRPDDDRRIDPTTILQSEEILASTSDSCWRWCRRCQAACKRGLLGRDLQDIEDEVQQPSITEQLLGRQMKVASIRNLPPLFSAVTRASWPKCAEFTRS